MEHPIIINSRGKASCNSFPGFMSFSSRTALAAAMISPIRRNIDYQGLARRCLVVEQLPLGALPTYCKDIK